MLCLLRNLAVLTLLFIGVGCSDFPELSGTISAADKAADFPELVNLDGLLSRQPIQRSDVGGDDLASRIAALNRKANALRRPVLTSSERQRFSRGVAIPDAIR